MNPQGDFANYIRKNYNEQVSFIFEYKPKDAKKAKLEFYLSTIVNPQVEPAHLIETIDF